MGHNNYGKDDYCDDSYDNDSNDGNDDDGDYDNGNDDDHHYYRCHGHLMKKLCARMITKPMEDINFQ